jgi:hypothetical protein
MPCCFYDLSLSLSLSLSKCFCLTNSLSFNILFCVCTDSLSLQCRLVLVVIFFQGLVPACILRGKTIHCIFFVVSLNTTVNTCFNNSYILGNIYH